MNFLKPKFWSYVNGDKLSFDFDGLKIIEDENSALASVEALEDGTVFIDIISSNDAEKLGDKYIFSYCSNAVPNPKSS